METLRKKWQLPVSTELIYQGSVDDYYHYALEFEKDSVVADSGALTVLSGAKTGRSPNDKRIVLDPDTEKNVDFGAVNKPISISNFEKVKDCAFNHLRSAERIFVVDGLAGHAPAHQLKIRVVTTRAYHALFMHNMLIRPSSHPHASLVFDEPDFTIFNAGAYPADPSIPDVNSTTNISLSFHHREMVILGTEYAGEMKKGVFTVMNYLMPKKNILSMHCSANVGNDGDVALFFGLSGTGKTTLSADPDRHLIGDDEHGWSDEGIFNIEGGCYAKCINLSPEKEPEIYSAIRRGTVLENISFFKNTKTVNFDDISITENTRASYPLEFMPKVKIPAVAAHPRNIIFLTCDAYGVLPPVSKLSEKEALYHFLSGYTAKVAGTEMGVKEPQATFSACFGAAFMVWHPTEYARLLSEKVAKHRVECWLVNTGWIGGSYGVGKRISLSQTRAIINAILDGSLIQTTFEVEPFFKLSIPKHCNGVPSSLLNPITQWQDQDQYRATAALLLQKFENHFATFEKKKNLSGNQLSPVI